jgi:uncharacterized protein (TIGR03437 family)
MESFGMITSESEPPVYPDPKEGGIYAARGFSAAKACQNETMTGHLPALWAIAVLPLSAGPARYTFSLTAGAKITAATVDPEGNAYFAGSTSVALPTTPGAFHRTFAACAPVPGDRTHLGRPGCSWAFAGKLSPDGALLWLTYVPEPNGSSSIGQIAIDPRRDVYLAGTYAAVDGLPSAFPVTPGAFETAPPGPAGVFVAKVSSSGSELSYATYFGRINSIGAICPDRDGNLYLGIRAGSQADLPLIAPLPGMAPSIESGYLAKLNATGSGLLFATWLNGPGARSGINALALDAAGSLYVTGACFYESPVADPCVPTTPGAFQRSMNGSSAMYAMKLTPGGTLAFSTLLSGSGNQGAAGIGVDEAGNVTLAGGVNAAGLSQPLDFPVTQDAFQPAIAKRNRGTPTAGFVAKLDASGSKLLYSTYFGGSSYDSITGFALDRGGDPVFGGYSYSPDLPVTPDSWQPCHPEPDFDYANGAEADFIGKLSPDGRSLSYASFVGQGAILPDGRQGSGLRLAGVDATGDLYLMGHRSGFAVLVRYRMTSRPKGSAACIVNAAHGYESALSPLGLIRIRGNDVSGGRSLSPTLTAAGTLPASHEGLQVFIGDAPAPLLEVAEAGITVVAPSPLPAGVSVPVRVTQYGIVTAARESPVQATAPGILTLDGSGFGSAAAINQDGSVNSQDHPAAPGSVVAIYLTGLGIANPPLQPGSVAAAPGSLQAEVQATLYTHPAEILYAGPAAGLLAGVYQVNLRVPETGLAGWVPLGIKAGGGSAQSQSGNAQAGIYVSCPAGSTCSQWP